MTNNNNNSAWKEFVLLFQSDDLTSFQKFLRMYDFGQSIDSMMFYNEQGTLSYPLLHFACKYGAVNIVKFLVGQKKANVNIIDRDGNTPIAVACAKDQYSVVSLLLNHGANPKSDIHMRDYGGQSASLVSYTCSKKDLKLLRLLLEKGANPNSQDCLGNTVLYDACTVGSLDVIKVLLDHGADQTITNNFNMGPRDVNDFFNNNKVERMEILNWYYYPLAVSVESQVLKLKKKREQRQRIDGLKTDGAITSKAANAHLTRINLDLDYNQRAVALKACLVLSRLPIHEQRFDILEYLTAADAEKILEKPSKQEDASWPANDNAPLFSGCHPIKSSVVDSKSIFA
mmetsp:Transcript_29406/g.44533  ORF Transcript_29406/g.44533 Transcript_29406/m.44533 type:complete len:343 (+) Transcript_29406:153-1181(+)